MPGDLVADKLDPPREGLIPGTWKMVDPSRLGGIVDRPRLPTRWTWEHVAYRMIEAHQVLKRMPGGGGVMRSAWPQYQLEHSEEASDRPRGASADAIARMDEALGWPMRFMGEDPVNAGDVNRWAAQTTNEEFEQAQEKEPGSIPRHALQRIADGLNREREVVR